MNKIFISICEICKKYQTLSIVAGSPHAMIVQSMLLKFSAKIEKNINLTDFQISIAKGNGAYPKVPWIGITIKGRTVSNSLSVSSCFSGSGEGMVSGLMAPSKLTVNKVLVKRTLSENFINVDGPNQNSKYNNRFVNPKEFMVYSFDKNIFLDHIGESLLMLKDHYQKLGVLK